MHADWGGLGQTLSPTPPTLTPCGLYDGGLGTGYTHTHTPTDKHLIFLAPIIIQTDLLPLSQAPHHHPCFPTIL